MPPTSSPILTCAEAGAWETALFAGDESKEWPAMQRAGRAIALAVLRDFAEIGGFPEDGKILVLVGKGHNGGDALIAAREILARHPDARAEVLFVFGERPLRPLAQRAWRELAHAARERVQACADFRSFPSWDLCLDGVFGFQFRPPADPRVAALLDAVNAWPIRLRAAIDLPSAARFRADFTYATGCVKTPALDLATAGRLRYLDLGFFADGRATPASADRVLTSEVLAPLAALRSPLSDKRTYGHVCIVAGSRSFPGAALMSVLAALHSGVGLVTAFVPESLVPAFAARAPEAMWVGLPETPDGGLALEGAHLVHAKLPRATALVLGSGLGREKETLALVADLAKSSPVPLVLDADALQPDLVAAGTAPRILTPHAGEYQRIAQGVALRDFVSTSGAVVVEKGPATRICGPADVPSALGIGERTPKIRPTPPLTVYHSFFGGPVLARGGSGDLLAGLIGGLLAQTPTNPLLAAARGVVWHGLAADALARAQGQTAVTTTQLLDHLSAVLRALPTRQA